LTLFAKTGSVFPRFRSGKKSEVSENYRSAIFRIFKKFLIRNRDLAGDNSRRRFDGRGKMKRGGERMFVGIHSATHDIPVIVSINP